MINGPTVPRASLPLVRVRVSILLVAVALLLVRVQVAQAQEGDRPNVLFIMSDDHAAHAISAYGGRYEEVAPTPELDRLAEGGVRFENAFVTNSICTPSRATLLTGKYAHANGVYKFTPLDQSQPTVPKIMREAGYETAMIGKWHLHSNPVGFDHFSILPGQGDYTDPVFIQTGDEHPSGWVQQGERTQFEGHSSDAIGDQALEYLRSRTGEDEPFMLFTHFKAPHDDWTFAERYSDYLEGVDLPEPKTLLDDYEDRSDALRKTTQTLEEIGLNWSDPEQLERETRGLEGAGKIRAIYDMYMKKYLRTVKGIDDNMGRILDYLDASGLAEETIVVYTSDQGFFLGEHGLYDKRFMYEESLRIPLLVRWPDQIDAGRVSEEMVLNVDFAPTILDAAGIEPHPEMQGRSFLPLLKGDSPEDWRESMYYRYYPSHFDTEPHYGVRTDRYKLLYYYRIDQWELFDLQKDPDELNNRYGDPEYQDVARRLKDEIHRLQGKYGDRHANDGGNPNIGRLAPKPKMVANDVELSGHDRSVVVRFRSEGGGTLFSFSDLDDSPYLDYSWAGNKTLYVENGGLYYDDSRESHPLAEPVSEGEWHTVTMVVEDGGPVFYLDGDRVAAPDLSLSADRSDQTFNIGAGLSVRGAPGYNFLGEIGYVGLYDDALEPSEIPVGETAPDLDDRTLLFWND